MKHYIVIYTNGREGDETWCASSQTYLGTKKGLAEARAYRDLHPGRRLLIEVDDSALVPKEAESGGIRVIE